MTYPPRIQPATAGKRIPATWDGDAALLNGNTTASRQPACRTSVIRVLIILKVKGGA
jgi:hypothetical protein